MAKIRILGFAGSLRKDSFNKALLRAALELLPQDAQLEIFDLEGLPIFNQDIESSPPEKVKELKAKVKAADAILIASPEHNFSFTAATKNALDWGSRPHGDNSWGGKAVGIMSASNGMIGGERGQLHLRQVLMDLNMHAVNKPEVLVSFGQDKIDASGKLSDERSRQKIKELLVALVELSKKLSAK